MKLSGFIKALVPLAIVAVACAEEGHDHSDEDPYAKLSPKRAALEQMLSERGDSKAFEAAIKKARDAGVSEQGIIEARFLYHVDQREDAKLAAMLPDFIKRKDSFKLEESEIFAVREDWLAVIEYVEAISALEKKDKDGFKKHITEAFWLSPRQAASFAPHIDRMRMDEAMRAVKIDFSSKFSSIFGGEPVALSPLMEKKKALLFYFWSPWSRECEDSMTDFKTTANQLLKNDIAVVSLMADDETDALKDAKRIVGTLGDKPPGAWLIDRETDTLSRTLRIQSVPAMVLISAEGKVLFNGHPTEDHLREELFKVAPALKQAQPKAK